MYSITLSKKLMPICSFQEEQAGNINFLACVTGKVYSQSRCTT